MTVLVLLFNLTDYYHYGLCPAGNVSLVVADVLGKGCETLEAGVASTSTHPVSIVSVVSALKSVFPLRYFLFSGMITGNTDDPKRQFMGHPNPGIYCVL